MSEVPSDTVASHKQNDFGPDYLGYYKHLLGGLLSQNEHSIGTFPGLYSELSQEACSGGEPEHNLDSRFYSIGAIDEGISEFQKERLMAILNESAVSINQEVDEILGHMLASFQIGADLREPVYSSASDEDLSMPHRSRKRKARSSSSYNVSNNSNCTRQVYNDIQALQGKGEICQEAITKYSNELRAKLDKMGEDLDGFLNILMSRSRPMTTSEKHKLGKKIQKLPQEALDRVVEIIQTSNILAKDAPDSITIDLEEQDNVTLWRLHYYVELVVKENKLTASLVAS